MAELTDYAAAERRSAEARAAALAVALPALVARAVAGAPAMAAHLGGVDPAAVGDRAALARLPVLRKSALVEAQRAAPPFGGFAGPVAGFAQVFQSPGPIYEPGGGGRDWWRIGRFLNACGVGPGDVLQNCFSYHLTPAGTMFQSAAEAVGATVLPAGTGQTELQVAAARDVGATVYAGTPDYLKVILDAAAEAGVVLGFRQGDGVGWGAVSVAQAGVCRPGDRLPPVLCHGGPGARRLRELGRRGDDRRRGGGGGDRAAGDRRPGAGRRGGRGGGDDAEPGLSADPASPPATCRRCCRGPVRAGGPTCGSAAGWGGRTRPPRSRGCSCGRSRWRRWWRGTRRSGAPGWSPGGTASRTR